MELMPSSFPSSLLSLVSPLSLQPSAAAARKVIGAHAVYLPCSTCSVLTYALRKGGCAHLCGLPPCDTREDNEPRRRRRGRAARNNTPCFPVRFTLEKIDLDLNPSGGLVATAYYYYCMLLPMPVTTEGGVFVQLFLPAVRTYTREEEEEDHKGHCPRFSLSLSPFHATDLQLRL